MFNDVVHAPPKLPGIRGHPAHNEARRPGQNKDLLMLNNKKSSQPNVAKVKTQKDWKSIKISQIPWQTKLMSLKTNR